MASPRLARGGVGVPLAARGCGTGGEADAGDDDARDAEVGEALPDAPIENWQPPS